MNFQSVIACILLVTLIFTIKNTIQNKSTGLVGNRGPQGIQGIQGIQGSQGIQGNKGDTGSAGQSFEIVTSYQDLAAFNAANKSAYEVAGNAIILISDGSLMVWNDNTEIWFDAGDIKGNPGDIGPQGQQGIQGIQGIQGLQGLQGVKGDQGIQGQKGDQGIQGSAGQSFTILGSYANRAAFDNDIPNLTQYQQIGNAFILLSDGSLMTWRTLNGGEWFDAGDIQGPQGIQGPKGDQGIQGVKGDQGIQGVKGDQGIQGIQGIPGVLGSNRMHAYDTITQTTAGNENIAITFNTIVTSETVGFTIANNTLGNPTRITSTNAGIYLFSCTLQVHKKSGGGAKQLYTWFRVNEVNEPYSNQTVTLANNGDLLFVTYSTFHTLTAGQYVEVMWRATDNSLELLKNTTVTGIPEIPSVRVLINQVG